MMEQLGPIVLSSLPAVMGRRRELRPTLTLLDLTGLDSLRAAERARFVRRRRTRGPGGWSLYQEYGEPYVFVPMGKILYNR